MLVSYCAVGQVQAKRAYKDTSLGTSTEAWLNINPHLLIVVFLPVLIFESALNTGPLHNPHILLLFVAKVD